MFGKKIEKYNLTREVYAFQELQIHVKNHYELNIYLQHFQVYISYDTIPYCKHRRIYSSFALDSEFELDET